MTDDRDPTPEVTVSVEAPIDLHLIELTKDHTGEPESPPPTVDEMEAQVRTYQTNELIEALDDLRKTQNRVRKALRTIINELNRRSSIR